MTELCAEATSLLERVRAAVPDLAAEAAESERLRRPTDAAIRLVEGTGVFRMMVPRRFGGLELDLDTFVEVGLALGEADASLAWVATFCIEHNWMLCQFPEAFQKELYADRDWVLAPGIVAPQGLAPPEAGGFRLSGRWQWGTGVMHASWVIVGAVTDAEIGPASMRFLALPIEDVKVEDTWYVDGMAGTGSNDIVIEDVLIPEERTVSIEEMVSGQAHGAKLHDGPLYRTPMIPILVLAASMPLLGQAKVAVRGFRERLKAHTRIGSASVRGERPALQIRLADAKIEVHQAELLLRDVAADVMAKRADGSLADRARWTASIAHVVHQSRRVIQDISEASGASAHFSHHPLQRALRDVNVGSCHVVFDQDAMREIYGKHLLGLEAPPGLY